MSIGRKVFLYGVVPLAVFCALTRPMGAAAQKFAGDFMTLGGGARALGMGGAFCAVANDASAVYWNPAGISGFEKRQVLFMHAEQWGDLLNYNFAAYASPTTMFVSEERKAAWGVALIHLGAPDIPIAQNLPLRVDVDNDGEFDPEDGDKLLVDLASIPKESANDFALLGTFAMNSVHGRVGGTLKLIYSNQIAGFSSTGIGIDLGYMKQNVVSKLDIGVKLQDITGTYISWSTGTNEFIAPSVKLGAAYRIASPTLNGSVLLTADSDLYFEDRRGASQLWVNRYSLDSHFGMEMNFQDRVMVRGGFDSGNPAVGAGFRVGFLGFDYAYLNHNDDETPDALESTHRVSALAEF